MNYASLAAAEDTEVPRWQLAVADAILGWVLDAFDFFVVVFLFGTLAVNFHVGTAAIVYTLTLTLAMHPVGALLFGALADRFGRKRPLIARVLFISTATVLRGFGPNYFFFLVMRGMYGIGMGGYWGIGASYAMESSPRRRRGFFSGLMQAGYPFGYLLAAVAMQTVAPAFGWRAMFVVGSGLTVLIVTPVLFAPESASWKLHRTPSLAQIFRALFQNLKIFAYMLLLMTAMNCLSHGTQDLYPDFLKSIPGIAGHRVLGMRMLYGIPVIYNVGAIAGALFFGHVSERIGRRRSILLALLPCFDINSGMGLRNLAAGARVRILFHADWGAGRLGRHSRSSQRTLSRCDPPSSLASSTSLAYSSDRPPFRSNICCVIASDIRGPSPPLKAA
jgi:SHS family lactate transporter-like MFS transporter